MHVSMHDYFEFSKGIKEANIHFEIEQKNMSYAVVMNYMLHLIT